MARHARLRSHVCAAARACQLTVPAAMRRPCRSPSHPAPACPAEQDRVHRQGHSGHGRVQRHLRQAPGVHRPGEHRGEPPGAGRHTPPPTLAAAIDMALATQCALAHASWRDVLGSSCLKPALLSCVPAAPCAALQAYRELLVTTPGLGQYISGTILFEETLFQNTRKGTSMVDELNKNVRRGDGGGVWAGTEGRLVRVPGQRSLSWRALLQGSPPNQPVPCCFLLKIGHRARHQGGQGPAPPGQL